MHFEPGISGLFPLRTVTGVMGARALVLPFHPLVFVGHVLPVILLAVQRPGLLLARSEKSVSDRSHEVDAAGYVKDFGPFFCALKLNTGVKQATKTRAGRVAGTLFCTMKPVTTGDIIPGKVANVLLKPMSTPACWGAMSRWLTLKRVVDLKGRPARRIRIRGIPESAPGESSEPDGHGQACDDERGGR